MRRPVAMALASALAAFGLTLLTTPPAAACSCAAPIERPTETEAIEQSDAVFSGTVVERHEPPPTTNAQGEQFWSSAANVRWVFDVDSVSKGEISDPQDVFSAASGGSCGYSFEIGTAYRVFAHDEDGHLRVGLCGYTHRVGDEPMYAPSAEVETTSTTLGPEIMPAPPTEVPSPGARPEPTSAPISPPVPDNGVSVESELAGAKTQPRDDAGDGAMGGVAVVLLLAVIAAGSSVFARRAGRS